MDGSAAPMSFAILGLGTALPATRIDQDDALHIAKSLCCRTAEQVTWLPTMYGHTGIERRHLVLGQDVVRDVIDGTRHSGSPFLPTGAADDCGPTTAERMEHYVAHPGEFLIIRYRDGRQEHLPGPADVWLDRLKDRGRLILPMTASGAPNADVQQGAVFRITRQGEDFPAKHISAVGIFPCEGMHDPDSETALAAAFKKGRVKEVTRLYRRDDVSDEDCWVRGKGWCLAYR